MPLIERSDLLNLLAERFALEHYLEIGVQHPSSNFDLINVAHKIGVDPDPNSGATHIQTSDEFFAHNKGMNRKFDLVFIDGLHESPQVKKDFENSLACLEPHGYIVFHDSLPDGEQFTHVPRGNAGKWFGDVYKFILMLHNYEGIDFRIVDFDCGCTVVWKTPQWDRVTRLPDLTANYTWAYYEENRASMPIIPASEEKVIEAIGREARKKPKLLQEEEPITPQTETNKSSFERPILSTESEDSLFGKLMHRMDVFEAKVDLVIQLLAPKQNTTDIRFGTPEHRIKQAIDKVANIQLPEIISSGPNKELSDDFKALTGTDEDSFF